MSQASERGDRQRSEWGRRRASAGPDPADPDRTDRGYDQATREGDPVSADVYGREALELAAEEPRGAADPDWNGAPELAGIGEQRTWEAWSPAEELHEWIVGEPPAPGLAGDGESADALICAEIQQRLDAQHRLDTGAVRVSVAAGNVVLDGSVQDPETRRLVEWLVSDTPGVRDTVNHLEVRSPS